MQVEKINIERWQAAELYRQYRADKHFETEIDREIRITYQRIAQGKTVIMAIKSVVAAGQDEKGLPRLALCRATAEVCRFYRREDGSGWMTYRDRFSAHRANEALGVTFDFPEGSFPLQPPKKHVTYEAIVPTVPLNLRPKRGLQNYHILWEAEWSREVPIDPMLLRRIGKGDLWLVCAAWDLTEVERAALQARVSIN